MSEFVSNSVVLTYGVTASTFTALFAEDENFEIVSIPKQRLDWVILENIVGHRNIYNVRIQSITTTQRDFLYNYIQSDDQYVTINGTLRTVYLRDKELMLDLLDGYIENVVLNMEFEDRTITRPAINVSRTQGITTSSAGYASTASGKGTVVTMIYNYGSGDTKRIFRVDMVKSYKADILDHRWNYVDRNNGYKRLGYRLNFTIDFGGWGLGQTQTQLFDDRTWLKEFITAPTKRIEVFDQYIGDVVNDFSEVRFTYIGNNIYNKTLQLNWKAQALATNLPVSPSGQFILDSETLGTLDSNILG